MKFHFVGIGGAGMSGLARVLMEMGHEVTGSDMAESLNTSRLSALGAKIFIGHSGENLLSPDFVVVSSAVPEDNEELRRARTLRLNIMHRGDLLAALMNERYGIAVVGSHGKTTTTSMIWLILERAGLDPTVLVGGELNDIGGNAKLGTGCFLVAEADESDGSFLKLKPSISVVTNIDNDHLDNYGGDFQRLKQAFLQFLGQAKRHAVACGDDPVIRTMYRKYQSPLLYGISEGCHVRAEQVQLFPFGSCSQVAFPDGRSIQMRLHVPGIHNVRNALASAAVSYLLDVDLEVVKTALPAFTGVNRRFQRLGEADGVVVVDDYAHHPTEVRATCEAACGAGAGKVIAIFQPHRYTRTARLYREFGPSFVGVRHLIVTRLYSAGEEPIPGVSAELIAQAVAADPKVDVRYIEDHAKVVEEALSLAHPGDMVLTIGAGNVWQIGYALLERLKQRETTRRQATECRDQGTIEREHGPTYVH